VLAIDPEAVHEEHVEVRRVTVGGPVRYDVDLAVVGHGPLRSVLVTVPAPVLTSTSVTRPPAGGVTSADLRAVREGDEERVHVQRRDGKLAPVGGDPGFVAGKALVSRLQLGAPAPETVAL
jgi:hypothetical protein